MTALGIELRRRYPKTRQEAEYPIVEYDSRLDPEWKETRNDKETPRYLAQLLREHNPNLCTTDEWRNMEDKLPHTPENATDICAYFKRNRCKHGLSGKAPVGRKKECEAIHPQLCWPFLRHGPGRSGCSSGA